MYFYFLLSTLTCLNAFSQNSFSDCVGRPDPSVCNRAILMGIESDRNSAKHRNKNKSQTNQKLIDAMEARIKMEKEQRKRLESSAERIRSNAIESNIWSHKENKKYFDSIFGDWKKINDILRVYHISNFRKIPDAFNKQKFDVLDNKEEVEKFCSINNCAFDLTKKYLVMELRDLPYEISPINGYRILEIKHDSKSSVDEFVVQDHPWESILTGKTYFILKNKLQDYSLEFGEGEFQFLPILEIKSIENVTWLRIPSRDNSLQLWLSDKGSKIFEQQNMNFKGEINSGILSLKKIKLNNDDCIQDIKDGKIYFKKMLFAPDADEFPGGSWIEMYDYPKNLRELEYATLYKELILEVGKYQDMIFEMPLREYYFGVGNLYQWPFNTHQLEEQFNCDTKLFVKDISRPERRNLFLKHQTVLRESSFMKATFQERNFEDYFKKIDNGVKTSPIQDEYFKKH